MHESFNPYRAPSNEFGWPHAADVKPPSKQLTPEQSRGRVILLVRMALVLAISAAVMLIYWAIRGPQRLPVQAMRFMLSVALFCWLYRGSRVAKWITATLYLIATAVGTYALLLIDSLSWTAFLVAIRLVYASFVIVLFRSPSVETFLNYQRGKSEAATFSD